MGLCNDRQTAEPKAKEDTDQLRPSKQSAEEEGLHEIVLIPSSEIKTKTISTAPIDPHGIYGKKMSLLEPRIGHLSGGSGKLNCVEDSIGYMDSYTHVHRVLPPSGLQTSDRIAKMQDPRNIYQLANPQLLMFNRGEDNPGNQTFGARLGQIRVEKEKSEFI